MLTQRLRLVSTSLIASLALQSAIAADNSAKNLSENDKVSYSIGIDLGQSFQRQNIEINHDLFMKGMSDGKSGQETLLSKEEIYETLINLQDKLAKQQNEAIKELAENNKAAGEAFLKDNKSKPGVKTRESGLQYRIIKEGKGQSPSATDVVTTHYRGKLIDGTEFDSSYSRNEPATFPVNNVIPGWTEALQLMKPGSKWELFVPASLAYGTQGIGPKIGPNETLIFEVELISVKAPESAKKTSKK